MTEQRTTYKAETPPLVPYLSNISDAKCDLLAAIASMRGTHLVVLFVNDGEPKWFTDEKTSNLSKT